MAFGIQESIESTSNLKICSIFGRSPHHIQDYAQRGGLQQKFTNKLDAQLELLRSFPEMYAKFDEEVRKESLKNFPYSFYYQQDISQEIIDILIFLAQAKNPEEIQKEFCEVINLKTSYN